MQLNTNDFTALYSFHALINTNDFTLRYSFHVFKATLTFRSSSKLNSTEQLQIEPELL